MALKYRQAGFSLIELMIAITLGGVILAGVLGAVLSSKQSYSLQTETSNVQASYRFAMEFLARDLKLAGYAGCASPYNTSFANVIADAELDSSAQFTKGSIVTSNDKAHLLYTDRLGIRAVSGFDEGKIDDSFPSFFDPTVTTGANATDATSDAIVVRFGDPDRAMSVKEHDLSSNEFELFEPALVADNANLLAVSASCRDVSLFRAGAVTADTIAYGTTGNCTSVVKANEGGFLNCTESNCTASSCSNPPTTASAFAPGSTLMPYEAVAFYIQESSVVPATTALKRTVLSGQNRTTEELVLGAESLQITYGIDTTPIRDGVVDSFANADDVTDWNRVVSVRFDFLARSMERVLGAGETQTLADGSSFNDGYLREKISQTVQLRNR